MVNKHILDLDTLSGEEYMMGDIDGYIPDINYFFERAADVQKIYQYSQTEFKDMPNSLCTLYGNLITLSSRVGRELTVAERRELCQLRLADKDYKPEFGGFTSAGVDTVRRWWNTHNPENPIITFAVSIYSELGKKFFQKDFPVTTSLRGNRAYLTDGVDGTLSATQWGKTTFGHCRSRMGLRFYDTGKTKTGFLNYAYPSMDAYLESAKNGYEREIIYPFFLEKELSGDGLKMVKYMKLKMWNGEREKDNITRWEASRIAMRLNPKVKEGDIWSGRDPNKDASRYEVSIMMNRAIDLPLYTGTDRNQSITRKETILMLP